MPDESDFKNFNTIEEFMETNEGNKFYHDLYLKAVNHPLRREILTIVNETKVISKQELIEKLKRMNLIKEESEFYYHINYLVKALCINVIKNEDDNKFYYEITTSGKVIEYLK